LARGDPEKAGNGLEVGSRGSLSFDPTPGKSFSSAQRLEILRAQYTDAVLKSMRDVGDDCDIAMYAWAVDNT
jgi:hypothetical protein